MLTPIFYSATLPGSVRTLLVLSLSVTLAMGILPKDMAPLSVANAGAGYIIAAAVKEVAIGATLSLGVLIAFAAVSVAGQLLDIQIGFGIAQVFDPVTRTQIPILTSAFNHLAVIFFFLIDGHHTLLRAVAFSIDYFPLGQSWQIVGLMLPVLKHVGVLFSLGFALASPIVFCVLLVELSLGVVARNLPQINMFVIGIPVKILVGVAALSFWFVAMGGVLTRIQVLFLKLGMGYF